MIVVYSKPNCVFCERAKSLLTNTSRNFNVVHLDVGQQKEQNEQYITREQLLSLIPTARTMPQIIINGEAIGGFTELKSWIEQQQIS